MAEKGGHKHFMHKEIHEQPQAVADTHPRTGQRGEGRRAPGRRHARRRPRPRRSQKCLILACGTSHHAALIGKIYLEALAKLPVEVDLASEFRYRDPLVPPTYAGDRHLPERRDRSTPSARFERAASAGARTLAVCNVVDSAIPRESDDVLYTHAGPEIGVASTKCFTTQLAALFLLAVELGRRRGTLDAAARPAAVDGAAQVPSWIEEALAERGRRRRHRAQAFRARATFCSWAGACSTRWRSRAP